jgi:pimeloyl-ACP methyl ester carboxylesterase
MLRGIAAIATLILVLLAAFTFKSFTPPIFTADAVAELTALDVSGDRQFLLIRGQNRGAPVLLFLHGGPGMPAMYLAHDFQRDLEELFVVVHWDQRGAGKSLKKDTDPASLTIAALLEDTDRVVDYLRERLDKESVWLVGHSHGSYLGALYARRQPGKVRAFVGVGQVADFEREVGVQDAFLRSRLESLDLPANTEISSANREDLLFQTGSELYGETSFLPLIWSALMAPEYSLLDIMNVKRGSSFASAHMSYDGFSRNLIADERDFEIPIAVIMGAHDMTTPLSLAREYYEAIEAPDKRWINLERAAHFPHFERPESFTDALRELKAAWQ